MSKETILPLPAMNDVPSHTLLSDGTELPETLEVQSIYVSHHINRVATARIVLLDGDVAGQDFPVSAGEHFAPGKKIVVNSGYRGKEEQVFEGIVVKHAIRFRGDRRGMVMLECKDVAVKMTIGRKNAYFYESTDAEILDEIVGPYEAKLESETTSVTHKEMVQYHCSDWDFLVSRAEVNGKLVYNEAGVVKVAAPDLGGDPVLTLVHGENILAFEAEMDARYQYENVESFAWDIASQDLLPAEGKAFSPPPDTSIGKEDLYSVIGLETYRLQHPGRVVDAELQAWADATLLRSRLSQIRGKVTFQGLALVKPGDVIELRGVGERFNGKVFVSGVKQNIEHRNWTTEVQFGLSEAWFLKQQENVVELPAAGLLPPVQGLQIGVVVQVGDDPDGEDRVLVKMPLVDNTKDGVWARIATLDAGENRGSFFRPEKDDEVLLGFLNDDPRQPVVLGMLNSSAKPAPFTASDDNHEKGFVTRSEMKWVFNDDEKSLTVETPAGNKLVLSEADQGITMEDEHGNLFTLCQDGITLKSKSDLKLEAQGDITLNGVNITQEAKGKFAASGNGGAELTTSANAVIKGSLVQIN